MNKIIQNVESTRYQYSLTNAPIKGSPSYLSDCVCYNACQLAEQTTAAAIVAMTNSGYTAYQISSHRPHAQTFIFTANKSLLNTLSLLWGVHAFFYNQYNSTDDTISDVNEILKDKKLVKKGDVVINAVSIPIMKKQRTNMVKMSVIE